MNRQEALEKLENYFHWNYYDQKYDKETERYHKQNLEDIIKYLKQPVSLADFLGWEEDVEYDVSEERYKVVNGKLYWFNDRYNEWEISDYDEELIKFQQAKKIQPKKYFLRLRENYRKFYGIMNNSIYLNFDKTTGRLFLSNSNNYEACRTQFTKEEIEEIKKLDYIDFEQFQLIEVGEDE